MPLKAPKALPKIVIGSTMLSTIAIIYAIETASSRTTVISSERTHQIERKLAKAGSTLEVDLKTNSGKNEQERDLIASISLKNFNADLVHYEWRLPDGAYLSQGTTTGQLDFSNSHADQLLNVRVSGINTAYKENIILYVWYVSEDGSQVAASANVATNSEGTLEENLIKSQQLKAQKAAESAPGNGLKPGTNQNKGLRSFHL